jgi:O-acetyl-ADP-ribose deacetylase (regulator of RNase III)
MNFIEKACATKRKRKKLADCYRNSLQIAVDHHCSTIAFPNISTGIYKFPKEKAAKIAVDTVIRFMAATDKIEKVIFVCFNDENYSLYQKSFED